MESFQTLCVYIYIYILSFLDDIDAYIIQLEFDKY